MNATTLSLLFVATALLFRLPHLLGGHLALDGDEAIVGLMARDLLDGKTFPVFFYGQRYGLALFEVAPLAAAFRLFGEAPIVIKTTLFALWSLGGIFAVRASLRLAGATAELVTGLVLATQPAWFGWSMKARGGYVTAFVVSQLALWILAGFVDRRRSEAPGDASFGAAFGLGVCLAIGFYGQPLFVLPVLPFLVFVTPLRVWTALLLGAGVISGPLALLSRGTVVAWEPQLFGMPALASVVALPAHVATALSGVFFYTEAGTPPLAAAFAGRVLAAVLVFAVGYALASRTRDRWTDALRATAVGVLATLFIVLWIRPDTFAYRYLLPIVAPLAYLAGMIAARWAASDAGKLGVRCAIAALCAIGAAAAWADRDVSFAVVPGDDIVSEAAATDALLDHLHERGIADVFVLDPMYQWNLIFESGGEIDARWIHPRDRLPEISLAVDRAFRERRPVALIGDARLAEPLRDGLQRSGLAHLRLDVVAARHFVLEAPPEALLRTLGFDFDVASDPKPAR